MSVEPFDMEEDATTTLLLAIYNNGDDVIPSWWLETLEESETTLEDIKAILDCIPSITSQLQKVLEHFS